MRPCRPPTRVRTRMGAKLFSKKRELCLTGKSERRRAAQNLACSALGDTGFIGSRAVRRALLSRLGGDNFFQPQASTWGVSPRAWQLTQPRLACLGVLSRRSFSEDGSATREDGRGVDTRQRMPTNHLRCHQSLHTYHALQKTIGTHVPAHTGPVGIRAAPQEMYRPVNFWLAFELEKL